LEILPRRVLLSRTKVGSWELQIVQLTEENECSRIGLLNCLNSPVFCKVCVGAGGIRVIEFSFVLFILGSLRSLWVLLNILLDSFLHEVLMLNYLHLFNGYVVAP